jgi:hypothetical protein
MLQHLDSTKYYRGFSGSRDTILRKDYNKKKEMDKTKEKQSIICYQSQFRCFSIRD